VPLPAVVLEHRELSKLKSTFLDSYAARAVLRDGKVRLHAQFECLSTGTGRLSSRHPNVQQVPKRPTVIALPRAEAAGSALSSPAPPSAASVNVRDAFACASGWLLLSADYSQLEMRLMGVMSGDERLRRELALGGDLFSRLASVWLRKPLEAVGKQEREQCKQLSYGLIYGLGVANLAQSLGMGVPEARDLKVAFQQAFPSTQTRRVDTDPPRGLPCPSPLRRPKFDPIPAHRTPQSPWATSERAFPAAPLGLASLRSCQSSSSLPRTSSGWRANHSLWAPWAGATGPCPTFDRPTMPNAQRPSVKA
jgi:hypothetical protein